ncbi:MAG: NAD-dependent epimerase/dehydratase family protein [Planctomycetes bacterium]|nr:NAD-dependent epimerase/dehydratase family protein [Planctomycetota bacterium]
MPDGIPDDAEQAVIAANGVKGLLTCALRPHLIWGPGDPHLVPRLLDLARQGKLRRIGDGTNLIDVVFVENAALAHVLAGDALFRGSPVCGSVYFISQGEPVHCWEWINEILAMADVPPVTKAVSLKTAWRVGRVLETVYGMLRLRKEPPMTRFLATQLAKSHYFDIRGARNHFGYQPRVSMAEGMARLSEEISVKSAG